MAIVSLLVVFFVFALGSSAETIKLKFDGDAKQSVKLLRQLNKNGDDKGLRFEIDSSSFDYCVVTATGYGGWSTSGLGKASAVVLTPECEVLTVVQRGGPAGPKAARATQWQSRL